MPQISLYIDEKTLKKVENIAKRQHTSISKWVAEQIRSKIEPAYPMNFDTLFGSISDETFIEPDELSSNSDLTREEI
ncbi:MAG: hypothetical protein FD137_1835 [Spirochaetes bacterium]|nr:MAG: hypothetical protein FD137_1835 [Spirochaetota bacterium]